MRSNRRNAVSSRQKLHMRPSSLRSSSPPKTVALSARSPFIRHFSSAWYPSSGWPNAPTSPPIDGLIAPPEIRWDHGTEEQVDEHATLETLAEVQAPLLGTHCMSPSRVMYSSRAREKAWVNSWGRLWPNAPATD